MNDVAAQVADKQRYALEQAIKYFADFVRYAALNSRYAVPGEVDNVTELLGEIYTTMYGDE